MIKYCLGLLVILFSTLFGCKPTPKIIIKTQYGDIVCEVYEDKAPVTSANFLRYVDEGRFNDAIFYRTVTMDNQPNNAIKIEVLQGGLYKDEHPDMLPPIIHETTQQIKLHHLDGTLSMARLEPGTAASEFFICIGDQPELDFGGKRNPDGQGFAAFGKVIKGMEIVLKIHQQKEEGQMLVEPVKILSVERI